MHIVICSYHFGVGAEGICTERLVSALLERGAHVTVITSSKSRTLLEEECRLNVIVVPAEPIRPTPFFALLARIRGQIPSPFFVWSIRAARVNLPTRPDLVYGRSQPISSLISATEIAARYRAPLWLHFSDPFPSPWTARTSRQFRLELSDIKNLIARADRLSFTTEEGLAYQAESLSQSLSSSAFVLPHVAPPFRRFGVLAGKLGPVFVYLGSFYKERTADKLLEGYAIYSKRNPLARFFFVGTAPEAVTYLVREYGIQSSVEVIDRVPDVTPYLALADVLVAVDSWVGEPVFLTTKLVEYLVTDRAVLLLSPQGSPGGKLVRGMEDSVVHVTHCAADAVADGFERSTTLNIQEEAVTSRILRMRRFSPTAVASIFDSTFRGNAA